MSRNFELLQHASSVHQSAFVRGSTEAGSPAAPDLTSVDQEEGGFAAADLPCTGLRVAEKRELMQLVSAVFRATDRGGARAIAIAGIDGTDSAARIAACAGELLAQQTNHSVCVVDADVHRGRVHQQFGLESGAGFSDALLRDDPIRNYTVRVAAKLWVLRVGLNATGSGPSELAQMRMRMGELRREFAYCITVVPPVALSAGALVLGPVLDGILLVVEAGMARREAGGAAKEMLTRAGVSILGAVLQGENVGFSAGASRTRFARVIADHPFAAANK